MLMSLAGRKASAQDWWKIWAACELDFAAISQKATASSIQAGRLLFGVYYTVQ